MLTSFSRLLIVATFAASSLAAPIASEQGLAQRDPMMNANPCPGTVGDVCPHREDMWRKAILPPVAAVEKRSQA